MDNSHSQIVSFIWSIADDVLRGQYRNFIPSMVEFRLWKLGTNSQYLC